MVLYALTAEPGTTCDHGRGHAENFRNEGTAPEMYGSYADGPTDKNSKPVNLTSTKLLDL